MSGRLSYGYGYPLTNLFNSGVSSIGVYYNAWKAYNARAAADSATAEEFAPCVFLRYSYVLQPMREMNLVIFDQTNLRADFDSATAIELGAFACKRQKFSNMIHGELYNFERTRWARYNNVATSDSAIALEQAAYNCKLFQTYELYGN
jgi:hypothetical protein